MCWKLDYNIIAHAPVKVALAGGWYLCLEKLISLSNYACIHSIVLMKVNLFIMKN